jgi:hypothetical protein
MHEKVPDRIKSLLQVLHLNDGILFIINKQLKNFPGDATSFY